MNSYISQIIAEYNKHAKAADELAAKCEIGTLDEEGFHAFMANAIVAHVTRHASTNKELWQKFQAEAIH